MIIEGASKFTNDSVFFCIKCLPWPMPTNFSAVGALHPQIFSKTIFAPTDFKGNAP